jgi:hypothetical protein
MPMTYHCDTCGATGDGAGWPTVSVQFIRYNPTAPNPPGGRTLDATAPDLIFDTLVCRDAWCTKAGVPIPTPSGA